jgi:toxin ParE1/3/4
VTARLFVPRALRELRAAAVYIARDNPLAAEALLDVALRAARTLADHPEMGRLRPALAPPRYRFWSLTAFSYVSMNSDLRTPVKRTNFTAERSVGAAVT